MTPRGPAGAWRWLAWVLLLVATEAVSAEPAATGALPTDAAQCARWFDWLDRVIAEQGVADGGAARIEGFPYLRVDRFTAALAAQALQHAPAFAAWTDRLRVLDRDARAAELANLPAGALELPEAPGRFVPFDAATAQRYSNDCAARRLSADTRTAAQREALAARARVPDDYSAAQRALGLYPLVRWPFLAGVRRWERDTLANFDRAPASNGPTQRYRPPLQADRVAPSDFPRDALGVPLPHHAAAAALLARHAPVFVIERAGRFDHIGEVGWPDPQRPRVDPTRPAVYQRLAYARFDGRMLVQLVYTAWFSERPDSVRFDLLSGHLDAVVIRLTLDSDGTPLLVDSIHACGCYQQFFPGPRLRPRARAQADDEWLFVPTPLPAAIAPGPQRLVVSLTSGDHAIRGLAFEPPDAPRDRGEAGHTYRLMDDDTLRSLPRPDGTRRSLFGPDGLVASSARAERWLFWPMGIDSAGAMRQWGRHATAFIGRRHFDDADLLDLRFERSEAR